MAARLFELNASLLQDRAWGWVYVICSWGYPGPETHCDWPQHLTRNTANFTSVYSEICCPVFKPMWFLVPRHALGFPFPFSTTSRSLVSRDLKSTLLFSGLITQSELYLVNLRTYGETGCPHNQLSTTVGSAEVAGRVSRSWDKKPETQEVPRFVIIRRTPGDPSLRSHHTHRQLYLTHQVEEVIKGQSNQNLSQRIWDQKQKDGGKFEHSWGFRSGNRRPTCCCSSSGSKGHASTTVSPPTGGSAWV